jgi:hypothetical protein
VHREAQVDIEDILAPVFHNFMCNISAISTKCVVVVSGKGSLFDSSSAFWCYRQQGVVLLSKPLKITHVSGLEHTMTYILFASV